MKSMIVGLALLMSSPSFASDIKNFYCIGEPGQARVEVFFDGGQLSVSDVFVYDVAITSSSLIGNVLSLKGEALAAITADEAILVSLELNVASKEATLLMSRVSAGVVLEGVTEKLKCHFN